MKPNNMISGVNEIKGIIIAACLFVLAPQISYAQIEGHWEGSFVRKGAIQEIWLDFKFDGTVLSGTYSIPDMILYREPIKDVKYQNDSLRFNVFWGDFFCHVYDHLGEMVGENPDWNPTVNIHLKRKLDNSNLDIEQVQFTSNGYLIKGELIKPAGKPPYPTVIVIEGSTMEGRSLWTYRSIGDMFARNGIAALIYDKRGVADSPENTEIISFDKLVFDVEEAVKFLNSRPDIDHDAMGLFGISQGGWIAPLAANNSNNVSFAILMGGPATSIWQQELDRVEYCMKAGVFGDETEDVFTEDDITNALSHTALGFETAKDPSKWEAWLASVEKAKNSSWSNYVMLDSTIEDLQDWLLFDYDPEDVLKNSKIPILALFGKIDAYVPYDKNVALMESYLNESKIKSSKALVFDKVGHDFFTGATLVNGTWEWPQGFWKWNRRAVGLEDSIVVWTKKVIDKNL